MLTVDTETYSSVDLPRCGVHAYSQAEDFTVLLFGFAFDDEPVQIIDLAGGEQLPGEILKALTDPGIVKSAFNAAFERTCLARYLNTPMPPEQWRCSQARALILGLPSSLKNVAECLKLTQQKMDEGMGLIRYFSIPCKPTQANGGRTRNLPHHDSEKWELFKTYCKQDVEVERAIRKKLEQFPMPEQELKLWFLDQKINDFGIKIDMELVENAIRCDEDYQTKSLEEATNLTGLENPNSPAQLKSWLQDNHNIEVESLNKETVKDLLAETNNPIVKRALELRQEMSKTSVRKYEAMDRAVCKDGRVRGLLQYYGASTGRWAGRILNPQNLPRNNMSDLDMARELLKAGDYGALELLFDSVPDVLSQLIRTAFIPSPGHRFIVSDFSSIERVVLAWLAGERWVVEAYKAKKDLYIATASQMFNVPIDQIDKKSPLRQKGKVADLACIAEGQPVLTDTGLVPIEEVTTEHKVWDGEEWVTHDGVVFRGEKGVITYEGLTATKDHLVWIEGKPEPVRFEYAATSGAHLLRTGEISQRKDKGRNYTGCGRKARLYDILNAGPNNRFTVSNCLVHNCGYQGGVGALKALGALKMGLQEDELPGIVAAWREANPSIVKLWWAVEKAAIKAVRDKTPVEMRYGLEFQYKSGVLFVRLPSGRSLAYVRPKIELEERFNKEGVTYEGVNLGKWCRIRTYGGRGVENIVQGIARDCLAEALLRLDKAGYKIAFHVHDEAVLDVPHGFGSLEEVNAIMGQPIAWAPGLPMRAEGFEADHYKKD